VGVTLDLYSTLIRPILEYTSPFWSNTISQALRNKIESFLVDFLSRILEGTEKMPIVALRLELGTQSFAKRWADLTLRFPYKIEQNENGSRIATNNILAVMSDRHDTPWVNGVIVCCLRLDETGVRHTRLTFAQLIRDADTTLDDLACEQVTLKQSLTIYAHVRSWGKVPRARV